MSASSASTSQPQDELSRAIKLVQANDELDQENMLNAIDLFTSEPIHARAYLALQPGLQTAWINHWYSKA